MNYSAITPLLDIIISIMLIILNLGYALVLLKILPKEKVSQLDNTNIIEKDNSEKQDINN
jgi:hypothetical protein